MNRKIEKITLILNLQHHIKTEIVCWSKCNIHRDLEGDSEKTAKVIEPTATHLTLGKTLNKQNAKEGKVNLFR